MAAVQGSATAEAVQRLTVSIDALDREDSRITALTASSPVDEQVRRG